MSAASAPVGSVDARSARMQLAGWAAAAFVFAVFAVVSLVMRRANDGVPFSWKDQVGTAVIGVILAGLCAMPTRPRLHADADGVRLRGFLGGWRTVPWPLVVRVEFPRSVRFARLVLPGEETLAAYAVTRWDGQQAVAAMDGLRSLHAQYGPAPADRPAAD